MSRHRARARITKPVVCRALGPVFCLLWAIAVLGQEGGSVRKGSMPGGPYPRLPGAVTKAPVWIGNEAPFDIARFFAAPPRDRNAAPLYLDALFEFGSELESCYPAGPAGSQEPGRQGSRSAVPGARPTITDGSEIRFRRSHRRRRQALRRRVPQACRRDSAASNASSRPARDSASRFLTFRWLARWPGSRRFGYGEPWNGGTSSGRSAMSRACSG